MASLPVVRCTSSLLPLGCRHRERMGTGICTCARRVVKQTLWCPAEDCSTVVVVADLPDSHASISIAIGWDFQPWVSGTSAWDFNVPCVYIPCVGLWFCAAAISLKKTKDNCKCYTFP